MVDEFETYKKEVMKRCKELIIKLTPVADQTDKMTIKRKLTRMEQNYHTIKHYQATVLTYEYLTKQLKKLDKEIIKALKGLEKEE